MSSFFSRRGFLKGLAAVSGTAAGTRLAGGAGGEWLPEAHAQRAERSALLCVFLEGGYNACFPSANSFVGNGAFSTRASSVTEPVNGLSVDKETLGTLSPFARQHMASIGVRHGQSAHNAARGLLWMADSNTNYAVQLAAAMGGSAAIKAVLLGDAILNASAGNTVGGVSLQKIANMKDTIAALGGGGPDPRAPNRAITGAALEQVRSMSSGGLSANPFNLVTMKQGYDTAIETVKKPVQSFNFAEMASAYGHDPADYNVSTAGSGPGVKGGDGTRSPIGFRSRIVAAELMINAGANVVVVKDPRWDTHGDRTGAESRAVMESRIMPPLRTFVDRMLNRQDMNVVVAIFGDFSRTLTNQHQPNLTATVMGKYVKVGTTGKTNANVALPADTPSVKGFWAYLAAALKAPTAPFGTNPHDLIV